VVEVGEEEEEGMDGGRLLLLPGPLGAESRLSRLRTTCTEVGVLSGDFEGVSSDWALMRPNERR